MRRVNAFRAVGLLGLLCIAVPFDGRVALAQTWNGNGADSNWTTNANWMNPATAPVNNGTADVHFAGTNKLTPIVDTPYSVNSITFDSGAGIFVMSGSNLTVGAGGIINNSSSLESFNNNMVLGAAQTWNASSGDLVFGSPVDLGANLLTVDGTHTTTIAGAISGIGGSLAKNGSGTLVLGGVNTYDGGTTVNAGVLQGDTDSLQHNITVNMGATLAFNQMDADGTYAGVIDGLGALTVSGSHVVTFTGMNTYAGGTTISSGTLQAGALGALPDNTPYTVNGGTLDLNDNSLIASSLNGTGGTITLGAMTSTTLTVNNLTAANTDTYAGIISGAGKLIKMGPNTLVLTGVNSYTGGTNVMDGTLQGTTDSLKGDIVNDATVTFSQSSDGAYAGVISSGGDVTKEGTGNVSFSGVNTYTGTTTVNAGTLTINGSIVSATTVNAAGTLAGTGAVNASVTNNGTVSAGVGGSGTLTVNSFANSATGTVQADITTAGTNGVLAVTGAADLSADGTVNVNAAAGNYNAGQKFTFLTAAGGVTGQFTNITDNLAGLTPILGEDANSVFFTLLRNGTTYAAIARTQNQRAVGNYLDQISPTASGDLQTVLNGINIISDDEARAAFDQLGGPIHGTLAQIGVQNTSMVIYQVAKRLRSGPFTPCGGMSVADNDRGRGTPVALVSCGPDGEPCCDNCCDDSCSRASGWVLGYGQGGSARPDGNAPGVNFGMGGTVAGLEHWVDDCHLFGFYGGYVGTDVRTVIPSHDSGINGGQLGCYFFMDDGFSYYTALAGCEFDGYSTDRLLQFDDINRTATSTYSGWQSFAYLERGFSFQSCMSVFQPFVAVQYIYLRQNAFTEIGADSVDLGGNGATANSLRSMVGARWQYAIMNRNGHRTLPELHAMWMHEYLDSNTSVSEQFSPTPTGSSAFSIQGLDFGRDWAVLGANLTWEMHDCWSMFVNYDIQTNERETLHIGTGGLSHMW